MELMTPDRNESLSHGDTSITRRSWLKRVAATAAVGVAGVGTYAWRIEPHWVEVVHCQMPIINLPAALERKTLVQISDIHIGDCVDDKFLVTWFQRVADWQPDLVVFTGDFLTLRRDKSLPIEQMKRVLAHFPQGVHGTFGILGNHDYGYCWCDRDAANIVEGIAENAGIDILRNETGNASGLQIAGFDDYYSPNFSGDTVLKDVDLNRPTLVLCHNPDVVDLPVWNGYRGWILAGHTHGGQCKPPLFPPPVLPIKNNRYSAGYIPLDDGRRLYVNRALGHSMRVRFNARPEITVFHLVRDAGKTV
jgi:predicted MPP superfamily phosphohydrolase